MATRQGTLELLKDLVAQELLKSTALARLAYVWRDGTPRVVPIWFQWNGSEVVFGTPLKAPKLQALSPSAKVAVTIDGITWPYQVLLIRGTARVETVAGIVPEYALAAERYFGPEQGRAWVQQVGGLFSQMARVAVKPEWVGIMDFQTRFPSAIEAAMSGH